MLKETIKSILIAVAALLLVTQLVPYGRGHDNPPVVIDFSDWDRIYERTRMTTIDRDGAVGCLDAGTFTSSCLPAAPIAPSRGEASAGGLG